VPAHVGETERQKILEAVQRLARELNPGRDLENLGENAHLEYDLGLGSLERMELAIRLEKALERPLPTGWLLQASSLGQLLSPPGSPAQIAPPVAPFGEGQLPPPPQDAVSLVEVLQYQARLQPERPSLTFLDEGRMTETLTYAQLLDRACRIATGLVQRGVQPRDRVALMLPTSADFVVSFFAILLARAIPVPLYPPFRADQIEEHVGRQGAILQDAEIRLLIGFPQMRAAAHLLRLNAPALQHVVTLTDLQGHHPIEPRAAAATDLALIQYTSGSTGHPKGVMLSHENLLANIRAHLKALEIRSGDVCVTWLPLYHDMGLIGTLLGPIHHGFPNLLMGPQDFLLRPSRWLEAISRFRGTLSAAPNFAYELCARKIPDAELEGLDLSTWRVALNGAEAIRPETLERFCQRLAPYGVRPDLILPVYGLAEATLAVTFPPLGRLPRVDRVDRLILEEQGKAWPSHDPSRETACFVACGRPLDKMDVRVVDSAGNPVDDRWVGRLQFRGPSALVGYFGNARATAEVRHADGWVETGDRAYLAEGEVYLVGRDKNLILKGGRNLHAEDIEEVVAQLPGVRRGCVAVFGLPDSETGSEQLVVIAETRERDPNARRQLERDIQQQVVQAVGVTADRVVLGGPQAVPKTPSGKIRRPECRQRYLQGQLDRRRGPARQAVGLLWQGLSRRLKSALQAPQQAWLKLRWNLALALGGGLLLGIAQVHQATARKLAGPLARMLLRLVKVYVQCHTPENLPTGGACLVVANHTSHFDPFILLAACPGPVFFVAARGQARGLRGQLLRALGYPVVGRGQSAGLSDLDEMSRVLSRGGCLVAFPEGGMEHWPGLRPFQLGVFQIAARLRAKVLPAAIRGSRAIMPDRRFVPQPGLVEVTFCPPLQADSEHWDAVLQLSRQARSAIAAHCGDPLCDLRLRRQD